MISEPFFIEYANHDQIVFFSYKKRVNELQLIYHDRPISPAKEMIHWVEHVAKTRGAKHLRSLALVTPWYQKYFLDLLALVLVSLVVAVLIIKQSLPIMKRLATDLLQSYLSDSNKKMNKKDF